MTRSEELVFKLCRSSFLSLWSYANPRGKNGKELCDILVVCSPDIIIFSVKEIRSTASGDTSTDWSRWTREAIDASVRQIYGAERWLGTATRVIAKDGSAGLPLPDPSIRRVHRVAVALGSGGTIPIAEKDHGKGFVHVIEEGSLAILMRELDTVTDFTEYLTAKEVLLATTMVMVPGEENLLAMFLRSGRRFDRKPDLLLLGEGDWEKLVKSEPYKAKQHENKESKRFDWIIETFSNEALPSEPSVSPSETERVVRVMARESRLNRRILGKAFREFFEKAATLPGGLARMTRSPSGVIYVFLGMPRDTPRDHRVKVLSLRCLVARGLHPDSTTVVGIATERYEGKPGYSFDGCYLHMPTWTEEQQQSVEKIQRELGYFVNMEESRGTEDEYPGA